NPNKLPKVTLGDITVRAQIKNVCTIYGTLKHPNDPADPAVKAFGDCYYGAATISLECLGGAGIDVQLMLAKKAWFVGGGVSGFRILVPPGPMPPPLFAIYGFHGGIGQNCAGKPGAGR